MFRIQWIPHGFHLFIQNLLKKVSERVALEFLNRKLDIVDPGIELTTANYMSLPEQANNIQKKQFHPYLETLKQKKGQLQNLGKTDDFSRTKCSTWRNVELRISN